MKAIKIFGLLLMATFAFAACSKDDEEPTVDVKGTKWETTYASISSGLAEMEYKR